MPEGSLREHATLPVGELMPLTAGEQRAVPRFTLLIRAAKVITAGGEFLCVIRDASEQGISARIFHALPACNDLLIELQNGDQYPCQLVWQEEDRAGFQFHDEADIARIIAMPSRFAKRAIRLRIDAPGKIETQGAAGEVIIHDISQQGAKVSCEERFSIDQRIVLKGAGLRETNAKVRWRGDGQYGLIFEDTYQFGELARIVRQLQRIS